MKTLKNLIIVILGVLLIGACSTLKTVKLLKGGEIAQEQFKVDIPFEYRLGLIVLKVEIKGVEYEFLLDSGAPNVLSQELADVLQPEVVSSHNVSDSQNSKSKLDFVIVDTISIGGIDFLNTGATILDMNQSTEIPCIGIDGLIGANLMKEAIWKIDYQNQVITITSNRESLDLNAKTEKIPFYSNSAGTPFCDVVVNGQEEIIVTMDLGSNGAISLSTKTYRKLKEKHPTLRSTSSYGVGATGIYGVDSFDSTFFAIGSEIKVGDVNLTDKVVSFSDAPSTLGTKFFINYDVVFDWFEKEVLLLKRTDFDHSTLEGFGFSPLSKEGQVFVGLIISGSTADKEGLMIHDRITDLNGKDCTAITQEEWCEMIEEFKDSNREEINLTVQRDQEELSFIFHREVLLK